MFEAVPGLVDLGRLEDSNDKHDSVLAARGGDRRQAAGDEHPAAAVVDPEHRPPQGRRRHLARLRAAADADRRGDGREPAARRHAPLHDRRRPLPGRPLAAQGASHRGRRAPCSSRDRRARATRRAPAIEAVPYRGEGLRPRHRRDQFTAQQIHRMYDAQSRPGPRSRRRVYGDVHELARARALDPPPPRSRPRRRRRAARTEWSTRRRDGRGRVRRRAAQSFRELATAADELDVDGWLTSYYGPELDAIDAEARRDRARTSTTTRSSATSTTTSGPCCSRRRYTTYPSILETCSRTSPSRICS